MEELESLSREELISIILKQKKYLTDYGHYETNPDKDLMFEELWAIYPNKAGKAEAKKKFKSLNKKNASHVYTHLPVFIKIKPFEAYTHPMMSTYINQKRFLDELPQVNEPTPVIQSVTVIEPTEQEKLEFRKLNGLI